MALNRKQEPEFEALLQKAVAKLRASSPELFVDPEPYTDEEYAQILADAAEIERIWDQMEQHRGSTPRRSRSALGYVALQPLLGG